MRTNPGLLDLLLEVQTLDRVPRFGYLIRGVDDPESVSEHSWQALFLVWCLTEGMREVDRYQAMDLAVVHDLAELRLGDLPRTASRYFPKDSQHRAESAALAEIAGACSPRTVELLAECQEARTPEARLVKACDKLQLMIKVAVYESWGARGLERFWDNPDNFYDGGFPEVRRLSAELRNRRAEGDSFSRA